MSQLFSTELLPASDRIDAWQWNAQRICGDCRIELPRSSFHGSIEIRQIGTLKLTRFSSSPLSFWKWPTDTVSAENRSCVVITQVLGLRKYLQNGAEMLLSPGDSTLIDSARPWSSSCGTECVRLYFRVPRWILENRLQTREIPIARKIPGGSRVGATLFRLSQSLYDEAGRMNEPESTAALERYFQALAACLVERKHSLQQHTPELLADITHFVDAHLPEPTLAPPDVACAMGISLRHLHRVFGATGRTLGDYMRARRLEACRKDLANPRLSHKSITDIAFSWGFSDAAHFSHSFRKHFRVSPRVFRLAAGKQHVRLRNYLSQQVSEVRFGGVN